MPSEHAEQSTFFAALSQINHPAARWTYAVPNGFLKTKGMRLRAWREGVKRGVWDVHCPVPSGKFCGLWLEFKVGSNTLTEDQEVFGRDMRRFGHRTEEVRSWREALGVWTDYLNIRVEIET